ncbi:MULTISPECIES: tetratricopeptide repeat protein [unclassified Saccharothrix]|uniref:tetratricopeptide repeat protein n=1 Tax=unclassified Saccharothrix TaxID=2593673 RepID=UPI00307D49BF
MDLGAPHGIRFRFEAGLLRAVLLDVHRKPPLPVSEQLTAEAGARDLLVDEHRDGHVRTVLKQRFDLPAPAEWRLTVDAPGTETEDGVRFALSDHVSLHVSGSSPCTTLDDGVCVALPAGESELHVTVTSAPVYGVADTAVVCRPDQTRAAAVVLSCLPGFAPLLVVEDPDPRLDQRLADLLQRTGVRRAVVLCDYDGDLLDDLDLVHLSPDDDDLTDTAWRALREGDPDVLDAPPGSEVEALHAALRTGRPLRFVDSAPLPELDEPDTDEAVLVEDTGAAHTLVAAQYAHHRRATLVTAPVPDLTEVHRVVAEEQDRVTAAARAIGDAVKGIGFVEALWRYLSAGDHDPFAALEAVVTAQVPARVVHAVGDRRLTAFTTGLPYTFVRTDDANWTRKPIGHVAADPTLVVLTELYGEGAAREPGAFSLLFDTTAPPEADGSSVGHFTHPLVLSGADASPEALAALARDLPVELVFFNTHDEDDGIVLGDQPLSEIPPLAHRPIVVNNSRRPWTEVGREFLRAGARGYIGTLWTIPPGLATSFAATVAHRLTAEEVPAANAVVNTGTPGGIERSYLYLGTVNGRLDEWRDRSTTDGEAALAEADLLGRVARTCPEPPAGVLHREITALRRTAERRGAADTPSYVDVLLAELALGGDPTLADRVDTALDDLDLPEEEAAPRRALRHELTGRAHEERGEYDAALADFEKCVERGDACRDQADVLLRMAHLLVRQDRPEDARRAALEAREAFRTRGARARLVEAIGVLGELSGDDHETALRYAAEGHEVAVELEDRRKQAEFKWEECLRHHRLGDLDAAIEAGVAAVELFRAEGDDAAELAAVRELGACHRDLGELETAQHYAAVGLALAERRGAPADVAACHDELGRVLTQRGDHVKALEHYRHAVELSVAKGLWSQGAELLPDLAVGAVRANDPEALWTTALCGGLICEVAERSTWATVVPLVVDSMKRAIEVGPRELTERGMTDFAHAVTAGNRDEMPFQVGVLADVVVVLLAWLMDRTDRDITAFARELDRTTGGVLELANYIAVPFAQRARRAAHGWTHTP